MPFFSYLYNDKTFIRLSPFFIDVISEDTALIAWIKQEFKMIMRMTLMMR